jgi:hypothetical protein
MDRFILQGTIYYQQGRQCGRANCKCASGRDEDLHGPYWYKHSRGKVTYLGKELPAAVAEVRAAHERLLAQMSHKRLELLGQADALERLMHNEPLEDGDGAILEQLGFGAALL